MPIDTINVIYMSTQGAEAPMLLAFLTASLVVMYSNQNQQPIAAIHMTHPNFGQKTGNHLLAQQRTLWTMGPSLQTEICQN